MTTQAHARLGSTVAGEIAVPGELSRRLRADEIYLAALRPERKAIARARNGVERGFIENAVTMRGNHRVIGNAKFLESRSIVAQEPPPNFYVSRVRIEQFDGGTLGGDRRSEDFVDDNRRN